MKYMLIVIVALGAPVELLARGETLALRPSAPKIFGTLVQIELAPRP